MFFVKWVTFWVTFVSTKHFFTYSLAAMSCAGIGTLYVGNKLGLCQSTQKKSVRGTLKDCVTLRNLRKRSSKIIVLNGTQGLSKNMVKPLAMIWRLLNSRIKKNQLYESQVNIFGQIS